MRDTHLVRPEVARLFIRELDLIDPEQSIRTAGRTLHRFGSAIGTPEHMTARCVSRNVAFLRGMSAARALFRAHAA